MRVFVLIRKHFSPLTHTQEMVKKLVRLQEVYIFQKHHKMDPRFHEAVRLQLSIPLIQSASTEPHKVIDGGALPLKNCNCWVIHTWNTSKIQFHFPKNLVRASGAIFTIVCISLVELEIIIGEELKNLPARWK